MTAARLNNAHARLDPRGTLLAVSFADRAWRYDILHRSIAFGTKGLPLTSDPLFSKCLRRPAHSLPGTAPLLPPASE